MTRPLNAGALPDVTTTGRASLLASQPHILAWLVVVLLVVGYVILTALHDGVPTVFDTLLGLSFGAASGLSWPSGSA